MKPVLLFDTSVATTNIGDEIIMDAVKRIVNEIYPKDYIITLPTHLCGGRKARKLMKESKMAIVGGTNLLSSNMFIYRQWKLGLLDVLTLRNTILLGVGWWQYQQRPSAFSRFFLNNVLSKNGLHSVRDSYTVEKLRQAGATNVVNTSCPTLWFVDRKQLLLAPKKKYDTVTTTVTAYGKNKSRDAALLDGLRRNYSKRYFWPQGVDDCDYAHNELGLDGFEILPPKLSAFDDVLLDGCDYIGTRLHAGIRAMQKGRFAGIVAIDNRALEMGRDFGIPILGCTDFKDIKNFVHEDSLIDFDIPCDAIAKWKDQFLT